MPRTSALIKAQIKYALSRKRLAVAMLPKERDRFVKICKENKLTQRQQLLAWMEMEEAK